MLTLQKLNRGPFIIQQDLHDLKMDAMQNKIKAYHKIRRAIYGSRNKLHLQTCSIMIRVFSVRFHDESMEALLKDAMEKKNSEMNSRRLLADEALLANN